VAEADPAHPPAPRVSVTAAAEAHGYSRAGFYRARAADRSRSAAPSSTSSGRCGDVGRAAPGAGRSVVRLRDDRSRHHRCGGLRTPETGCGLQLPGTTLRTPARGDLGRDDDGAGRGPDGRQRGSPRPRRAAAEPGAGGAPSGGAGRADPAARTPATSPGRWPAPHCWPRWSSLSAPSASPRCGGSSAVSARTTGPRRSTRTERRSRWPRGAQTGGPRRPDC
jgi:hypothetical protein